MTNLKSLKISETNYVFGIFPLDMERVALGCGWKSRIQLLPRILDQRANESSKKGKTIVVTGGEKFHIQNSV